MGKVIKNTSDIDSLVGLARDVIYKALKPTIDAANKRLKRQGIDLKLSTKGKSAIELIATAKQAVGVQSKQNISNATPKNIHVKKQLPYEFKQMTREELAKQLQPTIDAANKRLKRLESLETISPALYSVRESGGKFSFKGKDRNGVIKEASRAMAFMEMKTSTLKGAKDFERNFVRKLSNKSKNITEDQRKVLWKSFRRLRQLKDVTDIGINVYGSDRLVRMLADEITEYNIEEDSENMDVLINKYEKKIKKEYESQMREYDELNPFDM